MPCRTSILQRPVLHVPKSPLCFLRIRLNSTRRKIEVVSSPPQVNQPSQQKHQWSFLTASRKPINTPTQDNDLETIAQDSQVSGEGRGSGLRKALFFNRKENRVIHFLRRTESYFNSTRRDPKDKIRAYFVGGWVRDKLLGKTSPDIDVVLNNITPSEFVQAMIDINGLHNVSPRLRPSIIHPEGWTQNGKDLRIATYRFPYDYGNGKTLEVVGMSIFPLHMKLEFVNARSKEGEIGLRVDAMERELTVNAMYLRLQTLAIRDPTEMGISDLQTKTLRTPKTAVQTYLDDPIRVLRAIRFASRFGVDGFTFDKDTKAALSDDSLAVNTRYQHERLYRELSIMLKPKNNPSQILRLLHETKYYRDLIVPPPPDPTPETYIPPTIRADNVSHVTSSWFINRLTSDWDLWSPFEQALIDIPSPTNKPNNKHTSRGLMVISEHIQGLAYTIATVMPWLNQFTEPGTTEAKTYAGAIVTQFGRLVRDWRMVDGMFANEAKTTEAVEMVQNGRGVREVYGEMWAAHVLCGMMFRWCDLCGQRIEEGDLEEIWNESRETWKKISSAVDEVQWQGQEEEAAAVE